MLLRRRKDESVEEVVKATKEKRPRLIKARPAFSSGSTLLNLALADNVHSGYLPGKMVNIIGDSAAGKSFLLWTTFAEVSYNKKFDEYKVIYDEPERSLEFNIPKLFGGKTEKRVVTGSIRSITIEDFHDNLLKEVEKGDPIIYGLDSFDALTSEAEQKRSIRDGTYGLNIPKLASTILRKTVDGIADTKSVLFIVSQTRDKIGVTFGSKKTRSGGKALKFYATHEMWLAVEGHIKRKGLEVGVDVIVKITKNKVTGKLRKISFPILYDYGVDDVQSMIDWLLEEGVWKRSGRKDEEGSKKSKRKEKKSKDGEDKKEKTKHKIDTGDFAGILSQSELIEVIEKEEGKLEELKSLVQEHWNFIEESISTKRKPRYGL